jgi:putative DNA primase/helicase
LALSVWKASAPATGTVVEVYLQSRGITLPPPPAIRFSPSLRHPEGGRWPAMVSIVRNGESGDTTGVLRTYLAHNGTGKAPVQPQKMMLGLCAGGAVRLAEPGDLLMVGEGIETCLAAMQATGYLAWAALSTSGMRSLVLPETVREDPGEAAARHAAQRWTREGRRVRIARPPRGLDFNDLLITGQPKRTEAWV